MRLSGRFKDHLAIRTLGNPLQDWVLAERLVMQLAQIIGRATSTVKHPALNGWRMLLVQPLDMGNKPDGEPLLAIDDLGSRRGDIVMITSDGAAVRDMMGTNNTPVRWAVLGIADELD